MTLRMLVWRRRARDGRAGYWRWAAALLLLCAGLIGTLTMAPVARAAAYACDEAGLDAALLAGGDATFSCATATTITVGATKTINKALTLDGGGLLTISGGNSRRVFAVDSNVVATLRNLTITGGNDFQGSGVLNFGALTVANVTFRDSFASGLGAGIVNYNTLIVTNATFSGNSTRSIGGSGIYNGGTLTVTGSTFSNNTTTGGNGGGGIFNGGGTMTVADTTFSGNSATSTSNGGGINNQGSASLTNVTLSGNTADGFGGGIANYTDLAVTNSTLTGNVGSGIAGFVGTVTLQNSLIVAPTGSTTCALANQANDRGGNLESGTGCTFFNPSSQSNADPLLGPLADNGGPTLTHLPAPGSPALGLGSARNCPAVDQRGVPRPAGAACTSGAVEGTVTLAPPTLPGGTLGVAYDQTLAASGGTAPYAYAVTAGALPAGLALGAGGVLSGTPAAAGTFTFTAAATDSAPAPGPYRAARSYTLAIAKGSQTVTFGTPVGSPAYIVGQQFTVGATASSGLPVSFAASGPCTVSGTTVTATGVGTCTVTASQPGDANSLAAPDVARSFPITAQPTVMASAQGGGAISPAGNTSYPLGGLATYTATPASGQVFLGWTLDNQDVGFASPLTFTVNANRTLVAHFAARPAFGDVAASGVAWDAITQLAARGIIKGYPADECAARNLTAPCFGPTDPVARAQIAALIVRAFGWDTTQPNAPVPFSDLGGVDPELQRAIAILAQYGIAKGYGDGTYGPTDQVTHAQAISLIARSMVQAGYWTPITQDDPTIYPNVTADSGHRFDLLTFVKYAGALPDRPTGQAWADWQSPASRAWTAQALWQALSQQFGVDRVP
jgi:hypothetical protein